MAAVGMALLLPAPAQADGSADTPGAFRFFAGGAVCIATPENPHWSSGASDRRILSKTRVSCESTYPSVTVRIKGRPERGPFIGPKYIAATSDQTQVIKKGKSATFYTPQTGGPQVSEPGWYTGTVTGQITAPLPGNIDDGRSKTVEIR
ncbi:hypothetical protein [Streptomyces hydrogenans]|uniref:hypothetical protein n=1 Tax=Streptomyces hydrogenans TaxID=1873719 RepID=UPI0033FAF205